MDRSEILSSLRALAEELHSNGRTGELYVVRGAAIALAFSERRTTRDIDAVFEPKVVIHEAADRVGERLGLPKGWLNDAVKGFLVGPDANAQLVFDLPGLRCSVASSPVLLAMKVLAHRVGEDEEDVLLLARHLGLGSSDAVLSVALEAYGDRLPAASRFFVEELFASDDGK